MADLPTVVHGTLTEYRGFLTLTAPTSPAIVPLAWLQANPGCVVKAWGLPSDTSITVDSAEVLSTMVTGSVTTYMLKVSVSTVSPKCS